MQVYSCPKEVLLLLELGVVRRVSYSWGQGPGGDRRFTLVVGELNQSLVSEEEREGGERRDVAWGVVDGNDVASVVKREGGRGRGGEGRGATAHTVAFERTIEMMGSVFIVIVVNKWE